MCISIDSVSCLIDGVVSDTRKNSIFEKVMLDIGSENQVKKQTLRWCICPNDLLRQNQNSGRLFERIYLSQSFTLKLQIKLNFSMFLRFWKSFSHFDVVLTLSSNNNYVISSSVIQCKEILEKTFVHFWKKKSYYSSRLWFLSIVHSDF